MEEQIEMEAHKREERGKNAARRLRRQGKVPAVVYGMGRSAIALSLDTASMTRIVQSPSGHNQIVNLKVDGGKGVAVLPVEWQVDPIRGDLLHVDMRRVDLTKTVDVSVPLVTVGLPVGVKDQGGLEEIVTREVEIRCMPLEVPASIEIDVSHLEIGHSVRVRDLAANEKYTYLSNPDRVLVHVVAPRAVEEPVVAEEEAVPTEPEVIEKGGEPEEAE